MADLLFDYQKWFTCVETRRQWITRAVLAGPILFIMRGHQDIIPTGNTNTDFQSCVVDRLDKLPNCLPRFLNGLSPCNRNRSASPENIVFKIFQRIESINYFAMPKGFHEATVLPFLLARLGLDDRAAVDLDDPVRGNSSVGTPSF
jgi:hypothetical protein